MQNFIRKPLGFRINGKNLEAYRVTKLLHVNKLWDMGFKGFFKCLFFFVFDIIKV